MKELEWFLLISILNTFFCLALSNKNSLKHFFICWAPGFCSTGFSILRGAVKQLAILSPLLVEGTICTAVKSLVLGHVASKSQSLTAILSVQIHTPCAYQKNPLSQKLHFCLSFPELPGFQSAYIGLWVSTILPFFTIFAYMSNHSSIPSSTQ